MDPFEYPDPSPDAERLVRELVSLGMQLHTALQHMEDTMALPGAPRDLPSPPEVLGDLLLGCLQPLVEGHPSDTAATAALLGDIGGIIEAEIFLLPLDPAPPCVREASRGERRARRRR